MDPLARIRGFPAAQPPNDDASSIRGNVTLEQKELSARIFSYHIANHPGSKVFSNQILNGLKLVEVNVRRKKLGGDDKSQGVLEGETICEVEVVEGMLNVYGTLAGGCAFHILDYCTFSALFVLGLVSNCDPSGVSTGINLNWHLPTLPGTVLRIVSTSITMGTRSAASRAEVYDKKTNRLLISAVHNIVPLRSIPSNSKVPSAKSKAKL